MSQGARLGGMVDRPDPPHLDLGGLRLRWLNGGMFRLDGAATNELRAAAHG